MSQSINDLASENVGKHIVYKILGAGITAKDKALLSTPSPRCTSGQKR